MFTLREFCGVFSQFVFFFYSSLSILISDASPTFLSWFADLCLNIYFIFKLFSIFLPLLYFNCCLSGSNFGGFLFLHFLAHTDALTSLCKRPWYGPDFPFKPTFFTHLPFVALKGHYVTQKQQFIFMKSLKTSSMKVLRQIC